MYLQKVEINNIRAIDALEMHWASGKEAGWHVIIGDNGSGKTTVLQAIALALTGKIRFLKEDWKKWVGKSNEKLNDMIPSKKGSFKKVISITSIDLCTSGKHYPQEWCFISEDPQSSIPVYPETNDDNLRDISWFSSAYGPDRRFIGSDEQKWKNLPVSWAHFEAHLSLFDKDVVLTDCLDWLKSLKFKQLEQKPEGELLDYVIDVINTDNFLPHGTKLTEVSSDGVFFEDGNGVRLHVNQLSNGYTAVFSLALDIIFRMVKILGISTVLESLKRQKNKIDIEGIVLIDEIDIHLHPSWQASIGDWLTTYFPKIQFIVTTHSPLVCRACGDNGSIWYLAKPGSEQTCRELVGIERDRLVYSNILVAYGTGNFGGDTQINPKSVLLRQRKVELQNKAYTEELSEAEWQELDGLRAKFPTEK